MAAPELDGLKLFVAFAFSGDAQAMAVETARVLITDQARVGVWCVGVALLLWEPDPTDRATRPPHWCCKGERGLVLSCAVLG